MPTKVKGAFEGGSAGRNLIGVSAAEASVERESAIAMQKHKKIGVFNREIRADNEFVLPRLLSAAAQFSGRSLRYAFLEFLNT